MTWAIDIDATSPLEAAQKAQRLQQTNRHGYWVGCFDVTAHDTTNSVEIDLDVNGDPQ